MQNKKKNNHLGTGFVGTPMLTSVLSRFGDDATAQMLLKNETFPSWLYPINQGATTMWERWNSYTHKDGFGDVSMNSFNHYSLGSCAEWMYKYCLGINAIEDGAGFNKVLIRPFVDFSGKLTSAEGSYDSINGKITAKWKKVGDTVEYQVEIPENIIPFYDFSQYTSVEEVEKGRFILNKN